MFQIECFLSFYSGVLFYFAVFNMTDHQCSWGPNLAFVLKLNQPIIDIWAFDIIYSILDTQEIIHKCFAIKTPVSSYLYAVAMLLREREREREREKCMEYCCNTMVSYTVIVYMKYSYTTFRWLTLFWLSSNQPCCFHLLCLLGAYFVIV